MSRETFEITTAARQPTACMVGIVGRTTSGKTMSAQRLAFGFQRVYGGDVGMVDTENRRGTHYIDRFPPFKYLPLEAKNFDDPAFGSLRYLAAVEALVAQGCKTIIIDSMSHEHEGPGGYLWTAGWYAENRPVNLPFGAWARPASLRKMMINRFVQLPANLIMCFRGQEKLEAPKKRSEGGTGEADSRGLQPISSEAFMFEMLASFLLLDHAEGCPSWTGLETQRSLFKLPEQFRHLFADPRAKGPPYTLNMMRPDVQLSEDIGQAIAEWSIGKVAPRAVDYAKDLRIGFVECATLEAFADLEDRRSKAWGTYSAADKLAVKAASEAAKARLAKPVSADEGP